MPGAVLPNVSGQTDMRWNGLWWALAVLLLLVLLPVKAPAQKLVLSGNEAQYELWPHMQWLADPQTQWDFDDIRRMPAERFADLDEADLNQGIQGGQFWLKVSLHNPHDAALSWVLTPETTYVDFLEVFERQPSGWQATLLSDHQPFAAREQPYRKLAYQSETPAKSDTTLIIRTGMLNPDSMTLRMLLSGKQQFEQTARDEQMFFGLFYGACLALMAISLLLWLSLGERVFSWYFLYLTSNALVWAALNGYAFQYLWPFSPLIHNYGFNILFLLFAIFALQFSKNFLDLRRDAPRLNSVVSALQWLFVGGILLRLSGFYVPVLYLSYAALMVTAILPFLGWYRYRQGLTYARWYALAWMVYTSGLIVSVLSASTNLFSWGMNPLIYTQVSSLLESFILMLALSDKFSELRSRFEEARRASHHDALTGVGNRRLLELWFKRWFVSQRHEQKLWVLLVDVDRFKEINDSYGHKAGDLILEKLARLMQEHSRPQDLVVRYGGEEFVLLMEAPSETEVKQVAQRLRRQFEIQPTLFQVQQIPHTVSIGIASVDLLAADPLGLAIERADKAMYVAKQEGRNRVVCFASSMLD